ncbi:MAG: hypothetical protein R2753_10265 [Chitinophagales bacterium]
MLNKFKLKNYLFAIVIVLAVIQCTTPRTEMNKHWKNYNTAVSNGDIATAIVEVNSIYAFDTTNQAVLDTLSRLYFISGNSYGAFNTTKRINNKSRDQKMIMAESALQIGMQGEAKALFTELNDADTSGSFIGIKYKLATLHFSDKEYEKAIALLNEVTLHDNSMTQTTRVKVGDNSFQDVSLYAASWNFAGYIQLLNGDLAAAEEYFNEALRAQPNFALAKNNLVLLNQEKNKKD